MRNCICIIIGLLLMSCNPFHQDTVMEPDVQEIIDFMHDYGNVIFDSDSDDRFAEDMKRLDIDLIIKNLDKKNRQFAGFVEESDSLLIFVKKSHSIFRPEKRIIYDFAKAPRNFGNDTITGASYEIKQLNDRWYFSTVGFD